MSAGSPTPPPRRGSLAQALKQAQPRSQKELNRLRKRKLTDDVNMRENDPMTGKRRGRAPGSMKRHEDGSVGSTDRMRRTVPRRPNRPTRWI